MAKIIRLNHFVAKSDGADLDHDEFMSKFIDFIELNGCYTGGHSFPVDDEEEANETYQ